MDSRHVRLRTAPPEIEYDDTAPRRRRAGSSARADRNRKLPDELGRKVHALLWLKVPAGDRKAGQRRTALLQHLFRSLDGDAAGTLYARLRPGGDLFPDFDYRLDRHNRGDLLVILGSRGLEWIASSLDVGDFIDAALAEAQRVDAVRPVSVAKGFGPLPVGIALQKEITFLSRRKKLWETPYALFLGQLEGKATVSLSHASSSRVKVAYSSADGQGRFGVHLADALLGADAALSVSEGSADATLTAGPASVGISTRHPHVNFKLAGEGFELSFASTPLSPMRISLPGAKLLSLDLARDVPSLKLTGTASVEITAHIDVIPKYQAIAKSARLFLAAAKGAQARVARFVAKGGRLFRAVYESGRTAVLKILTYVPERVIANIVTEGSVRRGLLKSLKTLGKLLGAAGILADILLTGKKYADQVIAQHMRERRQFIEDVFRTGYGETLAELTEPGWRTRYDALLDQGAPVERWEVPPPPFANDVKLRQWLEGESQSVKRQTMPVEEAAWAGMALQAFEVCLVAHRHVHPSQRDTATRAEGVAVGVARSAGVIAAFQDVQFFMGGSAVETETGDVVPGTGVDGWEAAAQFHRDAFGLAPATRAAAYRPFIHLDRVEIAPFASVSVAGP